MRLCIAICAVAGLSLAQSPPARPAFEVASVKPSPPPQSPQELRLQQMMRNLRPPGTLAMDQARVTLKGWTLAEIVAGAYRVHRETISGPAWLDDLRFDVEAKIPEGAPAASANEMLQ